MLCSVLLREGIEQLAAIEREGSSKLQATPSCALPLAMDLRHLDQADE